MTTAWPHGFKVSALPPPPPNAVLRMGRKATKAHRGTGVKKRSLWTSVGGKLPGLVAFSQV